MKHRITIFILCLFSFGWADEENFVLMDGQTNVFLQELGPNVDERFSPCSTFKIALSLMGYDAGILQDENSPVWEYQEGYEVFLESWKKPMSPQLWMTYSCVWYSKILSLKMGLSTIQNYLKAFEYGNRDASTGIFPPGSGDPFWINGSLVISPREQVYFIQKLVLGDLSASTQAFEGAKRILFKEELANGWKLYGKTGWSGSDIAQDGVKIKLGWFVGWIEKEQSFMPFAYLIRSPKIALDQRIPRAKQLILRSL